MTTISQDARASAVALQNDEFKVDLAVAPEIHNLARFREVKEAGFRYDGGEDGGWEMGLFHLLRSCETIERLFLHIDASIFFADIENDARLVGREYTHVVKRDAGDVVMTLPRVHFPPGLRSVTGISLNDTTMPDDVRMLFNFATVDREDVSLVSSLTKRSEPLAVHGLINRELNRWIDAIHPVAFLTNAERARIGVPPLPEGQLPIPRTGNIEVWFFIVMRPENEGVRFDSARWHATFERSLIHRQSRYPIDVKYEIRAVCVDKLGVGDVPLHEGVVFDSTNPDAGPADTFFARGLEVFNEVHPPRVREVDESSEEEEDGEEEEVSDLPGGTISSIRTIPDCPLQYGALILRLRVDTLKSKCVALPVTDDMQAWYDKIDTCLKRIAAFAVDVERDFKSIPTTDEVLSNDSLMTNWKDIIGCKMPANKKEAMNVVRRIQSELTLSRNLSAEKELEAERLKKDNERLTKEMEILKKDNERLRASDAAGAQAIEEILKREFEKRMEPVAERDRERVAELSRLRRETKAHEKRVADLERVETSLRETIRTLRADLETTQKENEELKSRPVPTPVATEPVPTPKKRANTLVIVESEETAKLKADRSKLSAAVVDLRKRLDAEILTTTELRREMSEVKARAAKSDSVVAKAEARVSEANAEVEVVKTEMMRLRKVVETLRKELDTVRKESDTLRKELETTRAKLVPLSVSPKTSVVASPPPPPPVPSSTSPSSHPDDVLCAICIERLPDAMAYPCTHPFCSTCLRDETLVKCPTCRAEIEFKLL